jgi:hypothetical protein
MADANLKQIASDALHRRIGRLQGDAFALQMLVFVLAGQSGPPFLIGYGGGDERLNPLVPTGRRP